MHNPPPETIEAIKEEWLIDVNRARETYCRSRLKCGKCDEEAIEYDVYGGYYACGGHRADVRSNTCHFCRYEIDLLAMRMCEVCTEIFCEVCVGRFSLEVVGDAWCLCVACNQ